MTIQSGKWVYIEGFINVQDDINILGGIALNSMNLGGSDEKGCSVYVHATSRINTFMPESTITINGSKDIDIFGAVIAGGTVGDNGVTWQGRNSSVLVTSGEQLFLDSGLLASGSVKVNSGLPGDDDNDLSTIITTAGGITAYGFDESGYIEVKSEGGKGTQFLVTLPFLQMDGDEYVGISSTQISTEKMAIQGVLSNRLENKFILQADELLAENKRKLKNRRVLVVDDNQVNLIVAKKLLEKNGLSVTTADSGASSIELLASHKFDIILMDIQMPIMNGYEATIKIKQKEGMNKTPIVALTASIGKDEIESIKKCGMQGVVDKPIDINQLFKTLADLLFKVEQ